METDLLKQQEKVEMMQVQVEKAQKDRQNLQSEMEILLDRINKLSDMLDKARVRFILQDGDSIFIFTIPRPFNIKKR